MTDRDKREPKLNCPLSWKRILEAFAIGSIVSLIGFSGLLISIFLIRWIFLLLSYTNILAILARFALSGLVILLWLYLWWKATIFIRNRLIFIRNRLISEFENQE